jgi:hypothetical protein
MRFILLILAVFLAMSTFAFSKERVELIYATKTYGIFHIVEDHFTMVHFEGTMDIMSSFFLITALKITDTKYLSMNSPGGYMNNAYMLGSFLKSNPDITFVVRNENMCVSACAFAALSAGKLLIGKNGLDFHLPYFPIVPIDVTLHEFSLESQKTMIGLIKYLTDTGYGHHFLGMLFAYTTVNDYITFYSVEDLEFFKTEKFFDDILLEEAETKFELNTR